jgi:hypothetical protein
MNSVVQLPTEDFLKLVVPFGRFVSLWEFPEVANMLENHPDHNILFHVERTTAARGTCLWYPMVEWEREKVRQREVDEVLEKQLWTNEEVRKELMKNPFRESLLV